MIRYASAKTYVNALIDKTGEKMACMITRGHHGKVDRVLSPCPDSEANPAWMKDKIFLSFSYMGILSVGSVGSVGSSQSGG